VRAAGQLRRRGPSPKRVERANKKELIRRIRRIEGQVRGVGRMIEENRYCVDILAQIAAARSALGSLSLSLLRTHTAGCVAKAIASGGGQESIDELMEVFKALAR